MAAKKLIPSRENPQEKPRKMIGITIRVDEDTNRMMSAILALKGMTLSGFLQGSIRQFIKDNYKDARELLDFSRIAGVEDEIE
jgi:hypothetical protein